MATSLTLLIHHHPLPSPSFTFPPKPHYSTAAFFPSPHNSLISVGAYASVLIIQSTVDVRTVVEGTVSSLDRSSSALVHKVPVEARERSVLVALVLKKGFTLLHSKLLEIPFMG